MAYFVWDKSLDVGVDSMNDEHKILIDLMNRLHDQYENKAPHDQLKTTLTDLASYAKKHFQNEEAYMQAINYPNFRKHKSTHEELLEQVGVFLHNFENSSDPNMLSNLFTFLKIWLKTHIRFTDTKYGEHSSDELAKQAM